MTTERSVEEIAREAMREAQDTGHLDPIVDALEAERKKREELEVEKEALRTHYMKEIGMAYKKAEFFEAKYSALKKAGDGLRESLEDAILELKDKYHPNHRIIVGYKEDIQAYDEVVK